ncbi:hypothetical protein M9H77_04288 [Catharanthus roseus]|uniref:Uncharacterized protein n=1 Tax=Catharanthus roseus TaxID=4058 RepID=A0ACC0CDP9_CATRO|nr:hypothetical protein M9H77_04288 [Catharanthus roseus]
MQTFNSLGFKVHGGQNAAYVWVHFPCWRSWDVFNVILEKTHVVSTLVSDFGPNGELFVRAAKGQTLIILGPFKCFRLQAQQMRFTQKSGWTSHYQISESETSCWKEN